MTFLPEPMAVQGQRGANMVEFALVAPLLFLLIFAILQFSLMLLANLSMQYAVREGVRQAIVLDKIPSDPNRYTSILTHIEQNAMGFYDMVNPAITVSLTDQHGNTSSSNTLGQGMFGSAGQILTVRLDCKLPLSLPYIGHFFPDGYPFTVSSTMRIEAS